MFKYIKQTLILTRNYSKKIPQPLRSVKPKSNRPTAQTFIDSRSIRAVAGKGGDGCISFLSLWANENAGPDGGDGGNGAHVIFRATYNTTDLNHMSTVLESEHGQNGMNKDCCGKNAQHLFVDVPVGTIVKAENGKVVGDLYEEGMMFVAARGGAGGKGNHYFATDTEQAPKVCEYGASGEDVRYHVEIRSIAQFGLIGFPNAGKSTLLQAISRARPKIAPYPFTTQKPHIGIVKYDDYEQIAVADLPGLIPDSHKNRGLGIQFLKHVERCVGLLYVLDMSEDSPWEHLEVLQYELSQFNKNFESRAQFVAANKMDLPQAKDNFDLLKTKTDLEVIPISAKQGQNLLELLKRFRIMHDDRNKK